MDTAGIKFAGGLTAMPSPMGRGPVAVLEFDCSKSVLLTIPPTKQEDPLKRREVASTTCNLFLIFKVIEVILDLSPLKNLTDKKPPASQRDL